MSKGGGALYLWTKQPVVTREDVMVATARVIGANEKLAADIVEGLTASGLISEEEATDLTSQRMLRMMGDIRDS